MSSDNLHLIRTELTMKTQKLQFEEEICEEIEDSYLDASTSAFKGDDLIQLDSLESWGLVSDSNSWAGFKGEDVQGDWEGRVCFDTNEVSTIDSASQPLPTEVGFLLGYRLDRSRIGSPQINSKFIKPQTSLESCLMAQLYKERVEIEECTCSIHPSQKPTFTDGNLIINRAPQQSCIELYRTREYKLSKDTHLQDNRTSFEVPRLPCVVAVDLQMEAKAKTGKVPVSPRGNSSKLIYDNHSNARGSLNSTVIFFLGLTMGIVHSLLGHQREIDNLRKSLKQTENLVQDLQEELEMKDGLTVNELSTEDYESPVHKDSYVDDANHAMPMLSLERELDSSSTYCNDENNDQNTKAESLRKIEAELEAELDRLESNMKSSGLEGKISDLSELDPDFVPSAIKGELRADLFEEETPDYAEEDERRNSVPQSTRYPVSPRDLSLRLYEVIHSRLEERVKELETALEYSERKIKCMESNHNLPCREVSVLKTGSWSNRESPDATDQPTVINLSGPKSAASLKS